VLIYGRQTLSITENIFKSIDAKIVKNPIKKNETLQLKFYSNFTNDYKYSIISINGKIITNSQVLNADEINISSLNSGIYFLKITDADSRTKILKFIKK
jgi:hypothetical protein